MAQEGGCLCGNVRYSVEGEPITKALCHCSDCKKISGSTYSTNAIYPESGFKVLKGTPKEYTSTSDSGNKVTSYFWYVSSAWVCLGSAKSRVVVTADLPCGVVEGHFLGLQFSRLVVLFPHHLAQADVDDRSELWMTLKHSAKQSPWQSFLHHLACHGLRRLRMRSRQTACPRGYWISETEEEYGRGRGGKIDRIV